MLKTSTSDGQIQLSHQKSMANAVEDSERLENGKKTQSNAENESAVLDAIQ